MDILTFISERPLTAISFLLLLITVFLLYYKDGKYRFLFYKILKFFNLYAEEYKCKLCKTIINLHKDQYYKCGYCKKAICKNCSIVENEGCPYCGGQLTKDDLNIWLNK